MSNVARLGDFIQCGDIIAQGSGNVFVNGMPVTTTGMFTAGHAGFPPAKIINGSTTVFVNNTTVALQVKSGHSGHRKGKKKHKSGTPIITGSPDVQIE